MQTKTKCIRQHRLTIEQCFYISKSLVMVSLWTYTWTQTLHYCKYV